MTRFALKHGFRAFRRWPLLAAGVMLSIALGARAQNVAGETTFKFAQIPDIGAIGSLSADSNHDIWATGVLQPVALHFDGNRLTRIPMVNGSHISKVAALSPTNVWAVGQQTLASLSQIQHFDGNKWAAVPSPHFAHGEVLNSVRAISANSVVAVGAQFDQDGNRTPLVEHFDGSTWRAVSVPPIDGGELVDIAVVSPSDIWTVGFDGTAVLTLHFDGTQWKRIAAPGTGGALHAVKAVSSNDVWAVGNRVGSKALTEHWDGTAWTEVDNPSDINSGLFDLSVISSTDIWAVGCTVTACGDGGGAPLIEHWDGTQWNSNAAPIELGGEIGLSVLTLPSRRVLIGGFAFGTRGPVAFLLGGTEGK